MKAIQTRDLTKSYKTKLAVDKLNLTVEQGELMALLGVNGAGKTTTIRMLTGLTRPSSGDAELMGDSVVRSPRAVKEKLDLSPQETAVARNLSVRENLEMMAGIYGVPRKQAKLRAGELMESFFLTKEASSKAKTLSGGMQRRLSIAMALITKPEILFLDEPTLGLDVLARRELWKAIRALKGKVTIILTTHYLEEAEALSDRIAVMREGKLKAVGTAAELMEKTGAKTFEDAFVALAEEGEEAI